MRLGTASGGSTVSRRVFLKALILPAAGTALLAACAPKAPSPNPTAAPAKPTEPPKPAAPAAPAAAAPAALAPTAAPAVVAPTPQPATGSITAKAPADKRNLVIVRGGDTAKLDPHMSNVIDDIMVTYNIFDSLFTRDPELKLVPQLAIESKMANETTWEFKLRPNVKFHNGDPLTSRDVKFSIERTLDPDSKVLVATVFTTVDKIEAPDEQTVRFITKKPDPLLPARLGLFGSQIIPEQYFKQVGADVFNQKPIGSGVVKFKEWIKDDRLIVEANKEYWGGAPDFDTVTFKPVPEPAARVASLLAGDADIITRVPSDQVQRINSTGKTRIEGAFYAGLYVLVVNSKNPPLDNPKVKQALSLAIDRETILKSLWRGQGIVPNGGIPKGDFAYEPERPTLPYDPAKAKAMLQESGYKGELVIIESGQGLLQNDREMAEAITEMWKKIGANAQVELIEASVRAQKLRDKAFKGMFWSDPTSTLQDPDGMMWRLLQPGGSQDYWRHPEFDKLGEAARFSVDEKLRLQNYRRMNDLYLEYLPQIPILQPIDSYGLQNYVNWRPNPTTVVQLRRDVFQFKR